MVRAQSSVDKAMAETLFREGKKLMQAGDYEHACPKLAESQRIDPALGALLNLAACHEAQGLIATAWLEYGEASELARRAGDRDRQAYAEGRAEALSPRLPRLAVSVAAQAGADQVKVELDGIVLGPRTLGVAAPMDPGTHKVVASGAGKKAWTQDVALKAGDPPLSITVPPLEADPTAPVAPAPVAVAAPAVAAPPAAPPPPPPNAERRARPLTVPIYLAGGVTILCVGGAIATGVLAHSKAADYDTLNGDPDKSESERQAAHDEAQGMQLANTVLTGAAIAGAAVTTILILTRPEVTKRAALVPWVSPTGAGLAAVGTL